MVSVAESSPIGFDPVGLIAAGGGGRLIKFPAGLLFTPPFSLFPSLQAIPTLSNLAGLVSPLVVITISFLNIKRRTNIMTVRWKFECYIIRFLC